MPGVLAYLTAKKSPDTTESTRGFLSFNCNNQHSTLNIQHSTLLRADFLSILDIDTLLHRLSYAAAVQVVNRLIASLLIQCY